MKYKLTFWQKLELIPLKIAWLLHDKNDRKSWHLVKKSMGKHDHNYTIPFTVKGFKFLRCDHEGCTMCDTVEDDNIIITRDGWLKPDKK